MLSQAGKTACVSSGSSERLWIHATGEDGRGEAVGVASWGFGMCSDVSSHCTIRAGREETPLLLQLTFTYR